MIDYSIFISFILLIILEHSLLFLKMLLAYIIEDVPREIEIKEAKTALAKKKKEAEQRLLIYMYVK